MLLGDQREYRAPARGIPARMLRGRGAQSSSGCAGSASTALSWERLRGAAMVLDPAAAAGDPVGDDAHELDRRFLRAPRGAGRRLATIVVGLAHLLEQPASAWTTRRPRWRQRPRRTRRRQRAVADASASSGPAPTSLRACSRGSSEPAATARIASARGPLRTRGGIRLRVAGGRRRGRAPAHRGPRPGRPASRGRRPCGRQRRATTARWGVGERRRRSVRRRRRPPRWDSARRARACRRCRLRRGVHPGAAMLALDRLHEDGLGAVRA